MGKTRRRSHIRGGFVNLYDSSSTTNASELSLAQGKNFESIHSKQHGGQNISSMNSTMNSSMPQMNSTMNSSMSGTNSSMSGTNSSMSGMNSSMNSSMPPMPQMNSSMSGGVGPVGDQGLLDPSLRGSAHLATLDRSFNEIAGMTDQAGGRRRRRKRSTKRGRKSRKTHRRKSHRRRRHMRGGDAPVSNSTMLLGGEQAQAAVNGMNPEWKLVEDASAFNPRS